MTFSQKLAVRGVCNSRAEVDGEQHTLTLVKVVHTD